MPLQALHAPIFERLQRDRTILLAGLGGGYDVFCGLPLYLARRGEAGGACQPLDLHLERSDAVWRTEALYEVRATTRADLRYFPELHLARRASGRLQPVYAFARTGVQATLAAYGALVREHAVDTVLLVDGGTNSLMRGDETGLGTPEEDAVSLAAVHALRGVQQKLMVCLGFGVDTHHGVTRSLWRPWRPDRGAWSLTPGVQAYRDALAFVHAAMPDFPSIVSSSVLDAISGRFGDVHATAKTAGSTLFINSLMALYWAFELDGVARRNLYLPRILNTRTIGSVARAVEAFRAEQPGVRPWTGIPL